MRCAVIAISVAVAASVAMARDVAGNWVGTLLHAPVSPQGVVVSLSKGRKGQ